MDLVSNNRPVCLAQINLQNARIALSELGELGCNMGLDVVLVQEPYSFVKADGSRAFPGIPSFVRTLYHPSNGGRVFSAIMCFNEDFDILHLLQYSTPQIVVAKISASQLAQSILFIGVYVAPSEDLSNVLDQIDTILTTIASNSKVIVCGDFNARSETWFDRRTDTRGICLEQFINSKHLYLLNQSGQLPTFSTVNGESHVDVTCCTSNLTDVLSNWQVKENLVSSDHRMITFSLILQRAFNSNPIFINDFHSINQQKFARIAQIHMAGLDFGNGNEESIRNIDSYLANITNKVVLVSRLAIGLRRASSRRRPWWTDQLDRMKRQLNFFRRRMQTNSDYRTTYRQLLADYKHQIKLAKQKSWQQFVKKDLEKDPWGYVYKLAAGKFSRRFAHCSILKDDNCYTEDIESTVKEILNKLMPDDIPGNNTAIQNNLVVKASNSRGAIVRQIKITDFDINQALEGIKKHKAPGEDTIRGVVLELIVPQFLDVFNKFFNLCFNIGYFPLAWKKGKLVLIPKVANSDMSRVGSLRPISLLSEMGKLFERIILNKLLDEISLDDLFHQNQFGFIKNKSTVAAISMLTDFLAISEPNLGKHKCVIFIDIKGAFDNLWWPTVISELADRGVSDQLLSIFKSYFSDRSISYATNHSTQEKTLSKGCPQGSVLGPYMWNLAIDIFLRNPLPTGCISLAYADDVAIGIRADNRRDLEAKILTCTRLIETWADNNKLTISIEKSVFMMFGSTLSRNPTVKIYGNNLKRVKQNKYLGVILDEKLNYEPHVNFVVSKAKIILNNLRLFIKSNWGNRNVDNNLLIIYKVAIIPIVSYALPVWLHRLSNSRVKRKLGMLHGQFLRLYTRAYRSVPVDTLQVLAKIPPLDLLLSENQARQKLKKGQMAIHEGVQIMAAAPLSQLNRELERITIDRWQDRWSNSPKGRYTFGLIPNIDYWLNKNVRLTHLNTQILSGHGNYYFHLFRIGKSNTDCCLICNQVDDPVHRITVCRNFSHLRVRHGWPINSNQIINRLERDSCIFDSTFSETLSLPRANL